MAFIINPEIWGPIFWNMLFDIAHARIGTVDSNLIAFFTRATDYLPCIKCRIHYKSFIDNCCDLRRSPECTDLGLHFLYPLKNSINRKLNKAELPVSKYLEKRKWFPKTGNWKSIETLLISICNQEFAGANQWCTEAENLYKSI